MPRSSGSEEYESVPSTFPFPDEDDDELDDDELLGGPGGLWLIQFMGLVLFLIRI